MLHALGIQPDNYHNIFYNPQGDTTSITEQIRQSIDAARQSQVDRVKQAA